MRRHKGILSLPWEIFGILCMVIHRASSAGSSQPPASSHPDDGVSWEAVLPIDATRLQHHVPRPTRLRVQQHGRKVVVPHEVVRDDAAEVVENQEMGGHAPVLADVRGLDDDQEPRPGDPRPRRKTHITQGGRHSAIAGADLASRERTCVSGEVSAVLFSVSEFPSLPSPYTPPVDMDGQGRAAEQR